jgi:hypothetical protein
MDGEKGYNEEEVGNLLRLMEWIMQLPEVLEKRYEALLWRRSSGRAAPLF